VTLTYVSDSVSCLLSGYWIRLAGYEKWDLFMYSDKRELCESLRSEELRGYEVYVLWPKTLPAFWL